MNDAGSAAEAQDSITGVGDFIRHGILDDTGWSKKTLLALGMSLKYESNHRN